MTGTQPLSPAELADRAIQVLTRELGPADTARFVQQLTAGTGDYTVDRIARFAGLTVDDLVAEMRTVGESNHSQQSVTGEAR